MPVNGYVLVFTVSHAFKAEKLLSRAGIDVKLVPTPRRFSSDCGISVYFTRENIDKIKKVLDDGNMEYSLRSE